MQSCTHSSRPVERPSQVRAFPVNEISVCPLLINSVSFQILSKPRGEHCTCGYTCKKLGLFFRGAQTDLFTIWRKALPSSTTLGIIWSIWSSVNSPILSAEVSPPRLRALSCYWRGWCGAPFCNWWTWDSQSFSCMWEMISVPSKYIWEQPWFHHPMLRKLIPREFC